MRLLKKVNPLPKVKHKRPQLPAYKNTTTPVCYLDQRVQADDARTHLSQPAAKAGYCLFDCPNTVPTFAPAALSGTGR